MPPGRHCSLSRAVMAGWPGLGVTVNLSLLPRGHMAGGDNLVSAVRHQREDGEYRAVTGLHRARGQDGRPGNIDSVFFDCFRDGCHCYLGCGPNPLGKLMNRSVGP